MTFLYDLSYNQQNARVKNSQGASFWEAIFPKGLGLLCSDRRHKITVYHQCAESQCKVLEAFICLNGRWSLHTCMAKAPMNFRNAFISFTFRFINSFIFFLYFIIV